MPSGRPQATVTFRAADPLWSKLRAAERRTGKSRGAILRELLDYFLDAWLAREHQRIAGDRDFRDSVQRMARSRRNVP
jgi:hypothetical protein